MVEIFALHCIAINCNKLLCFALLTTATVVAGPMDSSLRRHSTSSWAQSKPISSDIRFNVCRGFPRLRRAFCEWKDIMYGGVVYRYMGSKLCIVLCCVVLSYCVEWDAVCCVVERGFAVIWNRGLSAIKLPSWLVLSHWYIILQYMPYVNSKSAAAIKSRYQYTLK